MSHFIHSEPLATTCFLCPWYYRIKCHLLSSAQIYFPLSAQFISLHICFKLLNVCNYVKIFFIPL